MSGDTLRWVMPGANFPRRPGSRPATTDTVVVLFAADTLYQLDGGVRTPLPPTLVRAFRLTREMITMDRWLKQMGLQPE